MKVEAKAAAGRPAERSSLMNVGRRVDYAVRALSYLAAQPARRVVSRREIQAQQDIPAHFLSKILKRLESGGLVASSFGVRGGFCLKKPAVQISLRQVYECLEGPLCLMECLATGERACRYCVVCPQMSVWGQAQQILGDYLARVTLDEIAAGRGLREELADRDHARYTEPGRRRTGRSRARRT